MEPHFEWLEFHIKIHFTAGIQCVFLPKNLEKDHFSETLAGISTLTQWTPCYFSHCHHQRHLLHHFRYYRDYDTIFITITITIKPQLREQFSVTVLYEKFPCSCRWRISFIAKFFIVEYICPCKRAKSFFDNFLLSY